jgi:hypothetical protein
MYSYVTTLFRLLSSYSVEGDGNLIMRTWIEVDKPVGSTEAGDFQTGCTTINLSMKTPHHEVLSVV